MLKMKVIFYIWYISKTINHCFNYYKTLKHWVKKIGGRQPNQHVTKCYVNGQKQKQLIEFWFT